MREDALEYPDKRSGHKDTLFDFSPAFFVFGIFFFKSLLESLQSFQITVPAPADFRFLKDHPCGL